MNITAQIEIPEWTENAASLKGAIIQRAAESIIADIEYGLRQQVRDTVAECITAQVGTIVAEEIERPVQRTNTWGAPSGEPVQLKELILVEVQRYLSEKVNDRGEADRYSERKYTRLEYLLKVVATKAIQDEMRNEIDAAVQVIRSEMDGKLTNMIREAIKSLITPK